MLSILELNYHIPESEWLKMPCHVFKERFKYLHDYLKEQNKTKKSFNKSFKQKR